MITGELDQLFIESLTFNNVKDIYAVLKTRKTDLLDGKVKIARGSDGIGFEKFEANFIEYSDIICSKGTKCKYLFSPFKEISVPKPPFEKDQLKDAIAAGKIRTLSISTIQDTIFQELMSRILSDK
jgi:retron-type reverse transcriptase